MRRESRAPSSGAAGTAYRAGYSVFPARLGIALLARLGAGLLGRSRVKREFGITATAAVALMFALAPAANAELGVTSYFHFLAPEGQGGLTALNGAFVNHNGTGGASPGDVFAEGGRWSSSGAFVETTPGGVVNQATGETFETVGRTVVVSTATGDFVRSFGYDVVDTGSDDSPVDEEQRLTITASGGDYNLSCCTINGVSPTTKDLPYNATAQEVEDALDELGVIDPGTLGGSVTVTGGPSGPGDVGPYVYTLVYGGRLAGDDFTEWDVSTGHLTGNTVTGRVDTLVDGGGFEVCEAANGEVCHGSSWGGMGQDNSPVPVPGAFTESTSIALAPTTAPNVGNVLLADALDSRVNEYTPTGVFVRSFGWDVNAHGPNNSAVDEQQELTINATGGNFALSFPDRFDNNGNFVGPGPITGAIGKGEVTLNSNTITKVDTTDGEFSVGQEIVGFGIPAGTSIIGVGTHTLTLSANATSGESTSQSLTAHDIPYNASAAEVDAALESLPSIGGVGGTVEVTGPNGGPYTIKFGGNVGGDELVALGTTTAALTGGAQTATVKTLANGGAFETCVVAEGDVCKTGLKGKAGIGGSKLGQFAGNFGALTGVAEDSTGTIYVANGPRQGFGLDTNLRVQKFTPSGSGFTPSVCCSPEKQSVQVSAGAGQFRLGYVKTDGTKGTGTLTNNSTIVGNVNTTEGEFVVGQPIRSSGQMIPSGTTIVAVGASTLTLSQPAQQVEPPPLPLLSNSVTDTVDLPYNAAANDSIAGTPGVIDSVEEALNAVPAIEAEGGFVTVTGGPGNPSGTSPYSVTFNGPPLIGSNQPLMLGKNGATPLSGGSGGGGDQAVVTPVEDGAPAGSSQFDTPIDVAIDDSDHIYVSRFFPPGATTCPDGSSSNLEIRLQKFATDGTFEGTSAPCYRMPPGGFNGDYGDLSVDPVSGEPYLAVSECCAFIPIFGFGSFAFIFGELGPAPTLALNPPSNIAATGVTISGEIDANGPESAAGHPNPTVTRYQVQTRESGETEWNTYAPPTSAGFSDNPVPFSVGISGLTPKTTYEFRIILTKTGRQTLTGPVQTATTAAAPPSVENLRASNVTATSADLHARINARGTPTTYHFEYGQTTDFEFSTPETPVGESQHPVDVSDHLDGLEPTVYHFRIVATNNLGTTTSPEQTFNFYPESCPNEAVRQQTGAARLPDCRAYELVSPADAGAASLFAGGPNSPHATSPSRLSFFGLLGTIPGAGNPPNFLGDHYVATRTSTGWKTAYVGIPANMYTQVGGPPNTGLVSGLILSDNTLSHFMDWQRGSFGFGKEIGSMAPFMWDANGNSLGRLPSNAASISGGLEDLAEGGFIGELKPSFDFSHFFFSSANVIFAPGGQASGNGSVYDNNLSTGSVTVASKLSNGQPIPHEPGDVSDDYFTIPDTSTDGSHVLIGATATGVCGKPTCHPAPDICGSGEGLAVCPSGLPVHLYMRVGGMITYDVSGGKVVNYEGMAEDGSAVYFTSAKQITPDDHDTSIDLFRWSEATDSISRISAESGGGVGDTDGCSPAWTTSCNVEVVSATSEESFAAAFSKKWDNAIAAGSGDIYFYSPEQFVGGEGVPGRRNLYVYREGALQQVAALDADKPLTRIQVSPNGQHAAFITATQLTTYNNTAEDGNCAPEEFGVPIRPRCLEMYTYDAVNDEVNCVSCIPNGDPPAHDVAGSQNGIFMSDDGRAFFSTRDAVVPDDTNGIIDVYEFVSGRPQLISSGTGETDKAINGEAGLVGVSFDGVNVYFGTFQKLVQEDRNGQAMRFYDARTSGGFVLPPPILPCEAAEECRGAGSSDPTPPTVASSAGLGAGGNVRPAAKKHRCSKRHASTHRCGKKKHRKQKSPQRTGR